MWTLAFWKATFERMVAGAAASMLSAAVVGGGVLNAFTVDWANVLGVGAGGAVVMLLSGLAGNIVTGSGPSFTSAETVEQAEPQ